MGIKSRKRKLQDSQDGSDPQILEIEEKKREFVTDRTHANNIVPVIKILENVDAGCGVLCTAVEAVVDMITHVEDQGDIVFKPPVQGVESAEGKYAVWLLNCYKEAWSNILSLLTTSNAANVQLCSVNALSSFITLEAIHIGFPEEHYAELVMCVLEIDNPSVVGVVTSMAESYYDVCKATIRALAQNLPTHPTDMYLNNVVNIAMGCQLTTSADPDQQFLSSQGSSKNAKKEDKRTICAFNEVWLWILSQHLPPALTKKVLPELHLNVLPHLKSPLSLTDFYMDAFNSGGMMSILSLNGVFILMQQHNLDYPEFYSKLYTLIQPEVLHVSHCAAFFTLLNIFLSSTHLTEYLMCAYIKRLSRLTLTAPSHTLLMLFNLIRNLLIRHPNLQYLLHRTGGQDIVSDPYDWSELDPVLCKADASSLWEIKSLQSHVLPEISRAARFIDKNLPNIERKFKADVDMEEFFESSCAKISEDVPLTFVEPKSLFLNETSLFSKHWRIT